jgi:hypothetical protein
MCHLFDKNALTFVKTMNLTELIVFVFQYNVI